MSKTLLKLVALDEEDLDDLSAHVQDAVLKVGDLDFLPKREAFRPADEPLRLGDGERPRAASARAAAQRAALRPGAVGARRRASPATGRRRCCRCWRSASTPTEAPAGTVELVFAGGGAIRLEVECIEARLADLGGAWEASSRPRTQA